MSDSEETSPGSECSQLKETEARGANNKPASGGLTPPRKHDIHDPEHMLQLHKAQGARPKVFKPKLHSSSSPSNSNGRSLLQCTTQQSSEASTCTSDLAHHLSNNELVRDSLAHHLSNNELARDSIQQYRTGSPSNPSSSSPTQQSHLLKACEDNAMSHDSLYEPERFDPRGTDTHEPLAMSTAHCGGFQHQPISLLSPQTSEFPRLGSEETPQNEATSGPGPINGLLMPVSLQDVCCDVSPRLLRLQEDTATNDPVCLRHNQECPILTRPHNLEKCHLNYREPPRLFSYPPPSYSECMMATNGGKGQQHGGKPGSGVDTMNPVHTGQVPSDRRYPPAYTVNEKTNSQPVTARVYCQFMTNFSDGSSERKSQDETTSRVCLAPRPDRRVGHVTTDLTDEPDHQFLAFVSCLVCWPLGIIAIYYANMAYIMRQKGRVGQAQAMSRMSLRLSVLGIVAGGVAYVSMFAFKRSALGP